MKKYRTRTRHNFLKVEQETRTRNTTGTIIQLGVETRNGFRMNEGLKNESKQELEIVNMISHYLIEIPKWSTKKKTNFFEKVEQELKELEIELE